MVEATGSSTATLLWESSLPVGAPTRSSNGGLAPPSPAGPDSLGKRPRDWVDLHFRASKSGLVPAITSKGTGGWPVARPVSAPSSSHSCDGCFTARECQVDAEVLRKFPPIECWCVRRVTNSRSRLTSQQCWPRHLRPGEPAHGRTDPRSQGSIRASMGLFGRFASRQPGMQTQQRRRLHLRQASRGCHGAPCGRPLPPLQLTPRGKPRVAMG